ncbi:putative X-Pro dipeptidyl-peptidase [Actinoplanes missouriensis 431]|uniref:Putative X-Pro dipeptidyl-peptidase n=1 Tax=Actinoplanes missouriensis (strain ATCC 14538 / DSM 43046 / CBS 188.64 / JCM 3121 / NBRC 102363 / NCIMB 12654 / NRRL B-3342 / UNCC 431) TaxID=512565 RepID=I0H791_ACTM4|nr:CocE/NonD family hydrolase [Actinoplanes missouriensis]BAL88878.1 putative X-Pro dipeptidyl-peptidase [Actinoplanes missouriensis 431]
MSLRRRTTVVAGALITVVTLAVGGAATAAVASPPGAPAGVTYEENPRVPEGAVWTEAYFPSADNSGVELHADVLRPANLSPRAKTPVILAVSSYFSHAGQTGPEGWTRTGPSNRFADFTSGTGLFARGYTYVMVDLRGFGGSTGCLDWVGPGEQADVKAAIRWAATQPWSTGRVGMYGKSYDAVTGLVGNNLRMPALKAVVAQEPVWDMYNYLFSNGVPRPNVTGTPNAYNSIATMGSLPDDTARYQANAAYEQSHPECLADNLTNNNNPDPDSSYWRARNLAAQARGTNTPLFVTQGFIENNTKPEDMQEFLDNHHGVERGWLGQWEHVRGNETNEQGQLLMGRAGFFDEVMRFYDRFLKGIRPAVHDPAYAIEDNTGAWRAQPTWPMRSSSTTANLSDGTYVDDGIASTLKAPAGQQWDMEHFTDAAPPTGQRLAPMTAAGDTHSYFSWSTPVASRLRITGTPQVRLRASAPGNVMVRLWDVAPDGTAVMFDENVALIERAGRVAFDLKSTDWTLEAGHQLGVQTGTIGSGNWRDTPSGNTIEITRARLDLELQNPRFDVPTQGDRSPFLDTYLRQYTRTLTAVGEGTFPLALRHRH